MNKKSLNLESFIVDIIKNPDTFVDSMGNMTFVLQEEKSESGKVWGRYEISISPVTKENKVVEYIVQVGQRSYKDNSFNLSSINKIHVLDRSH